MRRGNEKGQLSVPLHFLISAIQSLARYYAIASFPALFIAPVNYDPWDEDCGFFRSVKPSTLEVFMYLIKSIHLRFPLTSLYNCRVALGHNDCSRWYKDEQGAR